MASAYLTRTVTASTATSYTVSFWVKINDVSNSSTPYFWSIGSSAGNGIYFDTDGKIDFFRQSDASYLTLYDGVLRDPSAWYHIVWSVNSGTGTAYVNGITGNSHSSIPALNDNTGTKINIHSYVTGAYNTLDCCMAHFHFIDGTAYNADTFGESDSVSGIWKPKTSPSVTYGSNGFFLKMENSSDMGEDSSGNNNDFTTSGTITQNVDTPSNNFATGNPLHVDGTSASEFINGNLTHTNSVGAVSSLAINKGKWYMEFKRQDNGGSITNWMYCGFAKADRTGLRLYRSSNGDYYNGSSYSSYGASWSDGDIVGVALDYDNDTIEFYKNGVSQGSKTSIGICDGDYVLPIWQCSQSSGSPYFHANFGSGYFGTTQVSSSNSDANGHGLMEYEVPSGYYTLNTKNIKEFG